LRLRAFLFACAVKALRRFISALIVPFFIAVSRFHTFFIDSHEELPYNKNRIKLSFLHFLPPGSFRRFFPVSRKNIPKYSFLCPRCGTGKEVSRGLYHI